MAIEAYSTASQTPQAQAEGWDQFERLILINQANLPPQQQLMGTMAKTMYTTSTLRFFREKEVICTAKSTSDAYVVLQGTVVQDPIKGQSMFTTLGINSIFGLSEMCRDTKMAATLRAGPAGCLLRVLRRLDYSRALDQRNFLVSQSAFKLLVASPICAGLTESDVLLLRESMTVKTFGPNEKIFTKHKQGPDEIYVVETGAVVVTDNTSPSQDFIAGIPGMSILPNLNILDGFGLVPDVLGHQMLSPKQSFGHDVLLSGASGALASGMTSCTASTASTDTASGLNGGSSSTSPPTPQHASVSAPAPGPAPRPRQSTATASADGCTCLVLSKDAIEGPGLRRLQFQLYRNIFVDDWQLVQVLTQQSHQRWMRL